MHYVIWMNLFKKETKIRGLLIAKSNNASSNLYLSGHIIAKWLKYSLYDNFMKNSWIYCMFLCTTLIWGTNTATLWLCKYVFSFSNCFNNTLQDKKVPTTIMKELPPTEWALFGDSVGCSCAPQCLIKFQLELIIFDWT